MTYRILPSSSKNCKKTRDLYFLSLKNDVNVGTCLPDPDPYVFGPLGSASGSVKSEVRIRVSGSASGSVTLVSRPPAVGCAMVCVCRCMTLLQTHSAQVRSSMANIPVAARKKTAAPATVAADSGPSGQVSGGGQVAEISVV
jgi:hypothetical protein